MGDDDTPDAANEPTKPDDLNVDRGLSPSEDPLDNSTASALGSLFGSWKRNETAADGEAEAQTSSAPAEKKPSSREIAKKLAKKQARGRKRLEPYDPETDAAERAAEGLPPRVIGTMESDKMVIQGFTYPPEPDSEADDDPEITGPFSFLDKAMDWFRRAPVMGTIVLVFGTAVIVVPIVLLSLDEESTEIDPSSVEFIDDVEDNSEDGSESDSGDAGTDDTGADDTGAADTETESSSDESQTEGDAIEDTNAGVYVGTAIAQDPCGPQEYDVNFRFTWFNNGQATGEQLFTPNGNAFSTSEGNWEENVAILISEAQIWVFTAGERPRLQNAYIPEGQAPPEMPDFGELVEGMTDDEFAEAFGLGDDACVPVLTDVMFAYTPFPPSNSGG